MKKYRELKKKRDFMIKANGLAYTASVYFNQIVVSFELVEFTPEYVSCNQPVLSNIDKFLTDKSFTLFWLGIA